MSDSTNPTVDWYFSKAGQWQKEVEKLRKIVLDCHLIEELKWGCPCYTFNTSLASRQKSNIVGACDDLLRFVHDTKIKL